MKKRYGSLKMSTQLIKHTFSLRSFSQIISTSTKIEFIKRLANSGLEAVESTSFVSPKWVPQMADHVEVVQGLDHNGRTMFPVLTPNIKGYEAAVTSCLQSTIATISPA
jgi:hydroxymethylglutaryl-CoA lyase